MNIVIKIGSSLLTKQDGSLNKDFIVKLVKDIVKIRKSSKESVKISIITSGAVSSGRSDKILQGNFSVNEGNRSKQIMRKQMLAGVGQAGLISCYSNEFKKHDVTCAQILVTRVDFAQREYFINLRTITENYLDLGIIPIFNENDVLSAEELNFIDNDQLASMITAMLEHDLLIILSHVNGVYDKSPEDPRAKLIPRIDDIDAILSQIRRDKSEFGRGGMKNKILSAKLASSLGANVVIAGGHNDQILSSIILDQKKLGTFIPAGGKKIKPLKTWLKIAAKSKGKVIVNDGLAELLQKKQPTSIMLTGIDEVDGCFVKNDVVSVCNQKMVELGRGQCRFDSDIFKQDLHRFKETKTQEDKNKTGKEIVVHYNQFVFC